MAPTEGGAPPNATFLGLGRVKFGCLMVPAGFAAAARKALGGRLVSPLKGGAQSYVTSGMSWEATQELGGWKPSGVKERVHHGARPGDVVPEMRAVAARASNRMGREGFPKGLNEDRIAQKCLCASLIRPFPLSSALSTLDGLLARPMA